MQKIEGRQIKVILTTRQLEQLKTIQDRHDMNLSEAVRIMLALGLDVYEDYSHIGVPQLAEFTKRIKRAVKDGFQPKLI